MTVKSLWGGAGASVLFPHLTVFTSSKGEILAISRKNCIIVLSNYALVNKLGH